MTNVVAINSGKHHRKAVRVRRETKKLRRQAMAGMLIGLVAASLMALSLDHLADGIALVIGCCWGALIAYFAFVLIWHFSREYNG